MTEQEIKSLFPLKAMITQEIIDNARLYNTKRCIGALTLKSVVPDDSVDWGDLSGYIESDEYSRVWITTRGRVSMMDVIKPQEVTFILE